MVIHVVFCIFSADKHNWQPVAGDQNVQNCFEFLIITDISKKNCDASKILFFSPHIRPATFSLQGFSQCQGCFLGSQVLPSIPRKQILYLCSTPSLLTVLT